MRGRAADLAWWAAFVCLAAVVGCHFFLLQVDNMPLSPLKLELEDFLAEYVNTFFVQHWNFFAPTPPMQDTWVVARAKLAAAVGSAVAGSVTPWMNVTRPLVRAIAKNRFTPLFLVEIGLSNSATAFLNRANRDPAAILKRGGRDYLKPVLPAGVDPLDLPYLRRTATASLEAAFPGRAIREVQVGFESYQFPRFTARNRGPSAAKMQLTATSWMAATYVTPFERVLQRRRSPEGTR